MTVNKVYVITKKYRIKTNKQTTYELSKIQISVNNNYLRYVLRKNY